MLDKKLTCCDILRYLLEFHRFERYLYSSCVVFVLFCFICLPLFNAFDLTFIDQI